MTYTIQPVTLRLSARDTALFFDQCLPGQRPSELLREWVEVCLADLIHVRGKRRAYHSDPRGHIKFVFFFETAFLKRIRLERRTADIEGFLLWCVGEMHAYFAPPSTDDGV